MEVIVVPLICAVRGGENVELACLLAVEDFRICIQSREHRVVHVGGQILVFARVAPGLQGVVFLLCKSEEGALLGAVDAFYVLRGEESSHCGICLAETIVVQLAGVIHVAYLPGFLPCHVEYGNACADVIALECHILRV